MLPKPSHLTPIIFCLMAGAASGYDYAGNVASWTRTEKGLEIVCGDRQSARIDVLTERLVRVRFAPSGEFPVSLLNETWELVKRNDDFAPVAFEVRDEDEILWLTTAHVRVKIEKSPLRVSFLDSEGRLLTGETDAPGMAGGDGARLRMVKSADEHFFGLGVGIGTHNPEAPYKYFTYPQWGNVSVHGTQLEESEITLDQTGKKTFFCLGPNWSGQCMTPAVIPFFMSTRGYGVYLNEFRDSVFDLGCTEPDAWTITLGGPPNNVPGCNSLDYYFLYGPSFKTILDDYTDLTGRTPLVPKWSLGYFQICDFNQKQSEVLDIARGFRERDFPCDTLLLEPGWTTTPYRMDGWSSERFPNPSAMIAALKDLDFHLGLWQCGPADWVFTSWDLLKRHINHWGVDITNPEEVEKYIGFHKPYYDQGIRFFKQDGCGQSEWMPDAEYHNGMTGREMHNIIPTLYSKVMYEGYREHAGKRPMNFNPMVSPSQQRYPGVWPSGDAGGGYQHFRGEMNLGLSGHTYTSHDFGDRSPAGIHWSLLGPWCPGALSGIPQGDMCQFYLKLRYRLIPYIYTSHHQAYKTGTPYMRAMVLEYPDNPVTYELDHQCMLGDWLLLSTYTQDVYLPAGTWFDYWSGEVIESHGEWKRGCTWPETVGGGLFVKGGAIIPMGPVTPSVDKEPQQALTLDVYPDGNSAWTLYEDDGVSFDYENGGFATTEFRSRRTDERIDITLGAPKGDYSKELLHPYLLTVHTRTEPAGVSKDGHALTRYETKDDLLGEGSEMRKGWYFNAATNTAWIKPTVGWHFTADERGDKDPEKDTLRWSGYAENTTSESRISIALTDSAVR